MRGRLMAALALGLALGACGPADFDAGAPKTSASIGGATDSMAREGAADMAMAPAPALVMQEAPQDAPPGGGQTTPDPSTARQIAYEYTFTFALPTVSIEGLMNAQRAACEAAGPSRCYVVSSQISGLGEESTYGAMQLRATQDWVAQFRRGLPEAMKPFEAILDASTESSQDLTVQIVDTSARLNSLKTMRDRLQTLLAERPGRLSDLLELERELARVQGEIDSTESVLAAMRARVAMSLLTLNYQPKYTAASESIWRPLGDAFSTFLPNAIGALSDFVRLIAGLLPWVIILGGSVLVLIALWRLTFGRRPRPKPPAKA